MNKILSIVAICAILGVVASQATWNPTAVLDVNELTNFGIPALARYIDGTRVVLLGFNAVAGNSSNVTITRRYLNTTFAKFDSKAADDVYTVNMPNCNFTNTNWASFAAGNGPNVQGAWSHNGYFAVVCGGANVYAYVFKTNAVLNSSGVIVQSAALASAAGNYTVREAYFQDDYFYVDYNNTNTFFLAAFQAKAPGTVLANSPATVNTDPLTGTSVYVCDQRPKSSNSSFCTWNDATNSKYKQIGFTGATSGAIGVVNAKNTASNTVIAGRTYYGAATVSSNSATATVINATYDNNVTASISVTGAAGAYTLNRGVQYFDDYFLVYSVNSGSANNLYVSIIQKNTSQSNYTNNFGAVGGFGSDFTLPDSSYYVFFLNTNLGFSVGKVFNQTTTTVFGASLQGAIASIFIVGALLFAF